MITNKEFRERVYKVHHGKIKPLDKLINMSTKIRFICPKGHIWKSRPISIVEGGGCPICAKSRTAQTKKKHIQKRLSYFLRYKLHGKVKELTPYVNSRTKISFECKHHHKWSRRLYEFKKDPKCPICKRLRYARKHFDKKLKYMSHGKIKRIGLYKSSRKHVKVICNHGHIFQTLPGNIVRKPICPICQSERKLESSKHNVDRRIYKVWNEKIWRIGKYSGINHMTKFECWKGHTWYALPYNIINHHGCPICNKGLLPLHVFINKMNNIWHGYIKLCSPFKGVNYKHTLFECIYGHTWYTEPREILYGRGCPLCSMSNGEKLTAYFLNKFGLYKMDSKVQLMRSTFSYTHSYLLHSHGHCLSIDFMLHIDSKYVAIEVDGLQHQQPVTFGGCSPKQANKNFKKQKKHDSWKDQWCSDKHVYLIRIKEGKDCEGKRLIKLIKKYLDKYLVPIINNYLKLKHYRQTSLF